MKAILRRLLGRASHPSVPIPPPYRRLLAFNSDVEYTTWSHQLDLVETFERLGLETAHSFWLFGDPSVCWPLLDGSNRPTEISDGGLNLIREGIADTLHSFGPARTGGGVALNRERMKAGLDFLVSQEAVPSVYSNHGGVDDKQNVGGIWADYQEGDLASSPYYHLDLTTSAGIRYFWCDIDYHNDPLPRDLSSVRPLLEAQCGRDGSSFLRFKRQRGELGCPPWPGNFKTQLKHLLRCPEDGFHVIYQHFGLHRIDGGMRQNRPPFFDAETFELLAQIAEEQRRKETLVTTTSRLLDYAFLMCSKPWKVKETSGKIDVVFDTQAEWNGVTLNLNWQRLQGWSIKTKRHVEVRMWLGGESRSIAPEMSREGYVATIPWERRNFGAALEHSRIMTDTPSRL